MGLFSVLPFPLAPALGPTLISKCLDYGKCCSSGLSASFLPSQTYLKFPFHYSFLPESPHSSYLRTRGLLLAPTCCPALPLQPHLSPCSTWGIPSQMGSLPSLPFRSWPAEALLLPFWGKQRGDKHLPSTPVLP